MVIFKQRRHAATLESTPTSTSIHSPNPVQAPARRSHFTDMSSSDEATHILLGTDEAKARHTMSDTDEAGFIKRIDAAINQLESRKIIRALPGTDRFVVHGVIASLLGPEQVAAYTEAYRRLAGEHTEEGTDLTELDDQERARHDRDPGSGRSRRIRAG